MSVSRDGAADVLAWLEAHVSGDHEARSVIASHCAPADLVDTMTVMYLRLIDMSTNGKMQDYFDWYRDRLNQFPQGDEAA